MSLENITKFLEQVGEGELAEQVLEVFGKNAISFEQFDEVSRVFFKLKLYDKAIQYGEKAYAIASTPQQMYVIRHNLINVYNHNNVPEKALRYIRANEAVLPVDTDRDFEKAFALFLSNRKAEAGALLREKLTDPTLSEEQRVKCEFNLGTYDLLDGNFQQGMRRFLLAGEELGIWDNELKSFMNQPHQNYGLPRWNGTVKPGLKVLLIAEAGIGDELINVRFVKNLTDLGIEYLWLTLPSRRALADIYQLNGINALADIKAVPKEFLAECVYLPAMHLPIVLNLNYPDLWSGPYLTQVPATEAEKWQHYFANNRNFKVGLRWQGNPAYDQDLHRSIPLAELVAAVKVPAELYSIQRDTGLEQLAQFPELIDLSTELETLADLQACLNELDVVITSCTSVAHLAGALGKTVAVIVPISCYYVWSNPTGIAPWYGDNVKVFYQQKPRSWAEPLQELEIWLKSLNSSI